MLNASLAKEDLLKAVSRLQEKKDLSYSVGPDYYDPGKMENLEQYLGKYDEGSNTVIMRTEAKGLRYEDRTPRLDYLSIGDPIQLVREPANPFNENNIMILTESGENLGNLSAELCNVIAPLLDAGYAVLRRCTVSYIERIKERSRYARQGVLFVEMELVLRGI